jgi:hypothetical protein
MRIRAVAVLATVLLPLPLLAQTYNYTYTGNDFTVLTGSPSPFTTSDYLTFTFTFSSPLPDNWDGNGFYFGLPLSWSVSDGVQTYNGNGSTVDSDPVDNAFFSVDINGSGQIVQWYTGSSFGGSFIQSTYDVYASGQASGEDQAQEPGFGDAFQYGTPPGHWVESVSSVPEGSSFPLLLLSGCCLIGVGLFRLGKGFESGRKPNRR